MPIGVRDPRQIQQELSRIGSVASTIDVVAELYHRDRNLFFDLAVIGVPSGADSWQQALACLAGSLSKLIQSGFEVELGPHDSECTLRGGGIEIIVQRSEEQLTVSFLNELRSVSKDTIGHKDLVGSEVGESEITFKLGRESDRTERKDRLSRFINSKPCVLRLDDQDLNAIAQGMPAYVIHELQHCATHVVAAPTVVFEGTRASGRLAASRAYCGKPRRSFSNLGAATPAPAGMVYCVYADSDGFVFDWDWVREDKQLTGYPLNYETRFAGTVQDPEEAVLAVPSISPSSFKKSKAWHSRRGDCMFFYASDEHAYASRINNDLTEYRSLHSGQLVGCKVKNFTEIVTRVALETDGTSFPVGAILAASLIRQLENHQRKEKEHFIRILMRVVASIDEQRRSEFIETVLKLDAEAADYVQSICSLALQYDSQDRAALSLVQAINSRQQIEELYLRLIAVAGKTKVSAQSAFAA